MRTSPRNRWKYDYEKMLWCACPQNSDGNNDAGITAGRQRKCATLTVCLSGCAYSSIQKAIDASNNGDTILVNSGTYYENVNVNKRLKLRGIGNPVVDAGGSRSVITLAADGITLEGFTAIGSGLEEAGIWVTSSNNTMSGNNASNNNNGIYLESSSSNIIYNNYFSNNNAFDDGNNIWNINKTSGTNIINGAFSGGNFWSDYAGKDTDGDGLGDTMLPYDSSGEIANGGDYLPLIAPLPFAVHISISGKPIIAHTNSNILVEFTNFSSGDPYNISINAPNGTRVYYENANLNGTHLQTIHINWTPQSTGNYTIEAWGRGMIESAPVYVYDSKVVPVSDLGTIVLIAAIMLGFIGIKRRSK